MIVRMKKAAIIVRQQDEVETIKDVRRLGVFHVENQQLPQGKDISALQEEAVLLDSCLDVFVQAQVLPENEKPVTQIISDWRFIAKHAVDLWKRYDQLESFSRGIINTINEWERWGDFDPQEILRLREKGIFVRLYRIPAGQLKELPDEVAVKKIFAVAGVVYCAVISHSKVDLPFKEMTLPPQGLSVMRERLTENKKAMESIRDEIKKAACFYPQLLAIKGRLEKEIEFQQALCGMGKQGALSYLTGYVPLDKVEGLIKRAHQQRWGILVFEPSPEDNAPTLIRNPRWVALINPVFKFLEILPGYRESDISLPFLIFFSIFFGMLIGDAGYGLVYLLLTLLIHRKTRRRAGKESPFFLFYLLSICAIIWGFLTGTFFGQEWFLKAGYKPLLPALADEKGIQRFCFFLGALHLSIAHGWRSMLKAPSLSALGDLGWICILWPAFFIAKTLILGDAFPPFCLWLFVLGSALVILFTNPRKNILKSAEEWVAWVVTLPFSFISNFADVVSYIRLFAVGLAGVAIADAFNAMAAMVGRSSIIAIVFSAFVALIGNTLGIVLGPVSVLVHGVRLNLLEFSGHMGLSWSGIAYKPLKE